MKKIIYIINTYEYFFNLLKYIKIIRPDILHVNTNRDPFPLIVGRLFKIKTLLHVHEIFKKGFYSKYYSAFIFYLANRIIFPSKYCMKSYHNSIKYKKKFGSVYNGVIIKPNLQNDNSKDKRANNAEFRIAHIGTIIESKGHIFILNALNNLKEINFKLFFIGHFSDTDSYYIRLIETIAELGLQDRINFTGYLNNISDYLADMDLIVVTSKDEALPFSILEASLLSIPIIANISWRN